MISITYQDPKVYDQRGKTCPTYYPRATAKTPAIPISTAKSSLALGHFLWVFGIRTTNKWVMISVRYSSLYFEVFSVKSISRNFTCLFFVKSQVPTAPTYVHCLNGIVNS